MFNMTPSVVCFILLKKTRFAYRHVDFTLKSHALQLSETYFQGSFSTPVHQCVLSSC